MKQFESPYSDKTTSDDYFAICPYCEGKMSDPWEYFNYGNLMSAQVSCDHCNREFELYRAISATYFGCPEIERGEE